LWAGLLCGVLDIAAAFVVYGLLYRVKPDRILQGIASGLLGSNAFDGGAATALLGLFCHFVIAFGAAAVYLIASRGIPFLIQHAVVAGALYGVAVYFFMNLVVVRLSAAAPRPFSFKAMLIGVVIHIFCVGLPISLTIRRFAGSA
jgi:phage shock protein PspC (stress-responsive transcriptional regulator)